MLVILSLYQHFKAYRKGIAERPVTLGQIYFITSYTASISLAWLQRDSLRSPEQAASKHNERTSNSLVSLGNIFHSLTLARPVSGQKEYLEISYEDVKLALISKCPGRPSVEHG